MTRLIRLLLVIGLVATLLALLRSDQERQRDNWPFC